MRVFLKKDITVFYIDYCYRKFIYYFIENNFKNRLLQKESITLFDLQIESQFHKEVLIRWLYNLYKRKENGKKLPIETKILKKSKAVQIIFSKPIYLSIAWKIIDKNHISFRLSEKNKSILRDMENYLKIKPERLSEDEFIIKIDEDKKSLLENLLSDKSFTNIVHRHRYNIKDIKKFLERRNEKDEPYKKAYEILNLKEFTTDIKAIKKQYKHLAIAFHPDLQNHNCPQTQLIYTKKFQEINSAYQTIIQSLQNRKNV